MDFFSAYSLLAQQKRKDKWLPSEDEMLKASIAKNGTKSWITVSKDVPGRTGKQCRERWLSSLNPSIVKSNFSKEEDEILITLQEQYGNKWSIIATQLPGRTPISIKNRFNWILQKKKRQESGNQSPIVSPTPSAYSSPPEAEIITEQPTTPVFEADFDDSFFDTFNFSDNLYNHTYTNEWYE